MGTTISSMLSMGLTYCCCNAAGNLCTTCLGSTGEGTTGRKRSVLLLSIAVALALWLQYSVGPAIVEESGWIWKMYRLIPGTGKTLYHAWYDPCAVYADDKHLLQQCAGYSGVYRPMMVATWFFLIAAAAAKIQPSLNVQAWPSKYVAFLFGVLVSVLFLHVSPISGAYLWMARIGATLFVVMQQVILIDVAYNWNEDWVERADQADRLSYGSGSGWLQAIVATCAAFYAASLVGIILLYMYFDATCPSNTWIITLTLIGIIAMTVIQLSGSEGSLLTSSVMSLYAVYLAYSQVSKNPLGICNPVLGDNDVWGITVGLTLTAVSLAWTGWSWTASERLNVDGVQSARSVTTQAAQNQSAGDGLNLDVPFLDPNSQVTSGLVMDADSMVVARTATQVDSDVWKLNVVMALICCWVSMTLTAWGALEQVDDGTGNNNEHNAANPTVGRVNMAMMGISQWLAMGLYVWTLVAPRLFPDRDFS